MISNYVFDLDPIFKRIPQLRQYDDSHFNVFKLPGYTNLNFRLQDATEDWVLRIPRPETNQYINRQFEANNTRIAEMLELAPKCTWRDQSGLSLTRTLLNTRPISRNDFAKKMVSRQLIDILRRLHSCEQPFLGKVDLTSLLTRYYRLVPAPCQGSLTGLYQLAQARIKNIDPGKAGLLPSHNDLVLENILIDETDRIWIIDWEYSSMALPYWDLATVCNSFELDRDQSCKFLFSYLEHASQNEFDRLMDYRYVLQVISICWMAAFSDKDIASKIQTLYQDPGFETTLRAG